MSLVLNIYDFLVQSAAKLRYLFNMGNSGQAKTGYSVGYDNVP